MSVKPFRHSDRGESLSSCEKFGAGRIPEDHGRDSCRRSLSEFYCQNPLNLKVLNREENASICSTECVNGSIGFIAKEMIPPSFLNKRARRREGPAAARPVFFVQPARGRGGRHGATNRRKRAGGACAVVAHH